MGEIWFARNTTMVLSRLSINSKASKRTMLMLLTIIGSARQPKWDSMKEPQARMPKRQSKKQNTYQDQGFHANDDINFGAYNRMRSDINPVGMFAIPGGEDHQSKPVPIDRHYYGTQVGGTGGATRNQGVTVGGNEPRRVNIASGNLRQSGTNQARAQPAHVTRTNNGGGGNSGTFQNVGATKNSIPLAG